MAVPVVATLNVTRVEDSESDIGWASIGGGPGGAAEPSFAYQGSNLFNRKVTSSTGAGFYYTPTLDSGSPLDMTTAPNTTLMVKCAVTDYSGLQPTNGVRIRIGSSSSAYREYVIAGSLAKKTTYSEYPQRGGVLIVPIDPNLLWAYDSVSGSPNFSSVNYYAMLAAFTVSQAKSENVGLDALDVGEGLVITGGGGADPSGSFGDFFTFDEGTPNNRYGFFTKLAEGVYRAFGTLEVGDGVTSTDFYSSGETVLFYDGYFADGWSKVLINLSGPTTASITNSTLKSLGSITSGSDTRADLIVQGTTGTLFLSGTVEGFRRIAFTSACTVDGAVLSASEIDDGGATITLSTIETLQTSLDTATMVDPNFANITSCTFTNSATSTHAIKITIPGVYTLDALKFLGYGADGSSNSAILNDSGGSVTINIVNGGDTPTVTNGTGASTTVNNAVNISIKVLDAKTKSPIAGARVFIETDTGGPEAAGTVLVNTVSDASGSVTFAYNYLGDQPILGKVRKASSPPYYKPNQFSSTITASGVSLNILMIEDQ